MKITFLNDIGDPIYTLSESYGGMYFYRYFILSFLNVHQTEDLLVNRNGIVSSFYLIIVTGNQRKSHTRK